MTARGFDPGRPDSAWAGAWLAGRSLARGLPLPFRDRGGWRAEVGSETELRRWVFAALTPEFRALASEIADPRLRLRAMVGDEAMRAALPAGWALGAPSFAMTGSLAAAGRAPLPPGYRIETRSSVHDSHVFIFATSGELAASGHLGHAREALVVDRIVTEAAHRRRGLARVVMAALAEAAGDGRPGLLVATVAGKPLYASLGWRVVSPYASAAYLGDSPVQK